MTAPVPPEAVDAAFAHWFDTYDGECSCGWFPSSEVFMEDGDVLPDREQYAEHVAAAVVAALDLPARDRETAAKALDDAAEDVEAMQRRTIYSQAEFLVDVPMAEEVLKGSQGGLALAAGRLRARATALREGDPS